MPLWDEGRIAQAIVAATDKLILPGGPEISYIPPSTVHHLVKKVVGEYEEEVARLKSRGWEELFAKIEELEALLTERLPEP